MSMNKSSIVDRFMFHNICEAFDQYRHYDKHVRKLEEIKSSVRIRKTKSRKRLENKTVIDLSPGIPKIEKGEPDPVRVATSKSQPKCRPAGFLAHEKNITVKKENQMLLDKLLAISKGKHTSNYRQVPHIAKSLHYSQMKRDAERIDLENQKLLSRILQQNSNVSKKSMDKDFMRYTRYRQSIQKCSKGPMEYLLLQQSMRKSSLPPMKPLDSEGSPMKTQNILIPGNPPSTSPNISSYNTISKSKAKKPGYGGLLVRSNLRYSSTPGEGSMGKGSRSPNPYAYGKGPRVPRAVQRQTEKYSSWAPLSREKSPVQLRTESAATEQTVLKNPQHIQNPISRESSTTHKKEDSDVAVVLEGANP